MRREARQIGDAREQPILDPAQLDGQVARTRIRAGQTITASDLEPRAVVKRNQIADVEAKSGALTIRLRARVMADGAVGDVVECENVASRQRFTAYVRPDGVLEVL